MSELDDDHREELISQLVDDVLRFDRPLGLNDLCWFCKSGRSEPHESGCAIITARALKGGVEPEGRGW